MSTTTTINPTKDNWLAEALPTSKYGGGALVQIGVAGAIKYMNGIFEFDVSAYDTPSDVVSAIFTLTASASVGSANTMTLARLSQDFVEADSNYNTYDGSTSWGGGAGATGDAETTEPTYTFEVGSTTDRSVDIKELVIDAITRRSGVLRFICYLNATPSSSGYTKFYSRTTGAGTPPTLAVTVADRMVWQGDSVPDQGDLDVAANWSPATVPTETDIAIFSTSDENVTAGTLDCWKIYIAPGYAGTITSTPRFDTTELNITSPKSNLSPVVDLASGKCEVTVADAKTLTLDGDCNVKIWRTRSEITLASAGFGTVDAHSTRATFYADANGPDIKVTGALYRLADGCRTLTAAGSSSGRISTTDNTRMDVTLYGGYIHLLSEEIDELTMYSGRIKYSGNTGAPIATGDVIVYGGVLDTRVGSPTFGADSITLYAGRLLLDPGQLINVE